MFFPITSLIVNMNNICMLVKQTCFEALSLKNYEHICTNYFA